MKYLSLLIMTSSLTMLPVAPHAGSPSLLEDKDLQEETMQRSAGVNLSQQEQILSTQFDELSNAFKKAVSYEDGEGVPQDYQKAVALYEELAELGRPDAQYNLGVMYELGKGVPQDYSKALHWYNKAAENGNVDAQFDLGFMYFDGEDILQDYQKALYWWEKAAENGDAWAQFNLGLTYERGEGVPQDVKQALYRFQ